MALKIYYKAQAGAKGNQWKQGDLNINKYHYQIHKDVIAKLKITDKTHVLLAEDDSNPDAAKWFIAFTDKAIHGDAGKAAHVTISKEKGYGRFGYDKAITAKIPKGKYTIDLEQKIAHEGNYFHELKLI